MIEQIDVLKQLLPLSPMYGKIGGWVIQRTSKEFSNVDVGWGKNVQLRVNPPQHDPKTPGQLVQRSRMSQAAIAWNNLTDSQKQEYKDRAKFTKYYGYNLFCKTFLRGV